MPTAKDSQTSARSTTASRKKSAGFSEEERAAARERVKELKAASRRNPRTAEADGESDALAKIAEMTPQDRAMAERIHAIIKASAPQLSPSTWYGMPSYTKEGSVICHFQPAQKFKTRYPTLGFSDKATLDDGAMWPVAYALTSLTAEDEARIAELVRRAAS